MLHAGWMGGGAMKRASRLFRDESGATAIEYGLLCALISIIIIASVVLLGDPIDGLFGSVSQHFDNIEF